MEKIIELLNEFRPTVSCANFKEHYEFIDDDIYLIREWMDGEEEQFPMYVCYKKGEFIKWLVEKDKIDTSKLEKIWYVKTICRYDWQYKEIVEYSDYERLLMLLSISDDPIEFLISILN